MISTAAATAGFGVFVAASHALAAGPVNVIHPPVPVIIPHPVPPPVAAPPPVHIVVPPAPPPPVHVVVPPPAPAPVTHVDVPLAPPPVAAAHNPEPAPDAAATRADAAAPTRTFDPLSPPTQDPGLNNSPPTTAAITRPALRARPVVPTTTAVHLTPTVHLRRQLPPPPPARPADTATVTASSASPKPATDPAPAATSVVRTTTAATNALPEPPTARPDSPASTALSRALTAAQPTVSAVADPPASVATLEHLATSLPAARLQVEPGLVEALTAPFTFAPPHAPVAATPPATVADSAPPASAQSQPPAATEAAVSDATAASSHVAGKPAPGPFASAMRSLMSHLMPVVRSPFQLPQRMPNIIESWARSPWPLSRFAQRVEDSLSDSGVAIVLVVVGALLAMTGLTVAGAAIGGRRLKHTAWRRGRTRYGLGLPWDLADAAADDEPRRLPAGKDAVMPWPAKAAADPDGVRPDGVRDAELAARRRRVA